MEWVRRDDRSVMSAAPRPAALRPGWYPDPDGAVLFRRHDGQDWTDETRDVPAAGMTRFRQQQAALQRRTGASPGKPGGRNLHAVPRQAQDPGHGLAIAAFVLSIILPWLFVPLVLARMSRTRSNAAGHPRSGFALAAIIITWVQYAIVTLYLVFWVGLLALALGSSVDRGLSADTTAAKAEVKSAVNQIENCGAANVDGTYRGCVGGGKAPVPACRPTRPAAGATCADPIGHGGYVVRSTSESDVLFAERHDPSGELVKTCAPAGDGCTGGRW